MTDPASHHTDPLEEALSQGAQHAAQLVSLGAAMAQVVLQRRALRDARKIAVGDQEATGAVSEQERAAYAEARLAWAPAHDARWLTGAAVLDAARAWAAAASYADADPSAAAALRKCEDRLRQLHPYAMARYDRLRAEGMTAVDAMCEAAPMFDRPPHARPGHPAPTRPALPAGAASLPEQNTPGQAQPPKPVSAPPEAAETRGRAIAARLQARAREEGRNELAPAELATVLETVTNLPADVIERIAGHAARDGTAGAQQAGRMTAAQLAAASFPYTAAQSVAAATTATVAQPRSSTSRRRARRPGRSV